MNTWLLIGIGCAAVILLSIIIYFIIRSSKLSKARVMASEIDARYADINSNHIAFKINRAQAMSKKNPETAAAVEENFKKYEVLQRDIDAIQEDIYNLDDKIASKKIKTIQEDVKNINIKIDGCETQINEINKFLESFALREAAQREFSNKLKEEFRKLKLKIKDNMSALSVSYEGISVKVKNIEDKFSKSEEALYVQDYLEAQDLLDDISNLINNVNKDVDVLPELVKEVEGKLVVSVENCLKLYKASKDNGLYLSHLKAEEKFEEIRNIINDNRNKLRNAEPNGIRESVDKCNQMIIDLSELIKGEIISNKNAVETLKSFETTIDDIKHLVAYVTNNFNDNKEKYGLESLKDLINKVNEDLLNFENVDILIKDDLFKNIKPSSEIEKSIKDSYNTALIDFDNIKKAKDNIEKTSQDEIRAINQIIKLQVVLNEIEIKYKEHRLPVIKENFYTDLKTGREKIKNIEFMLKQVPLRIDDLNKNLDETITFIYNFYNNMNGIIGTSIMVERAIVLMNKFRSSYPDVDRELNKIEYYFKAGRYSKALEISISSIKKLYPDEPEDKVLKGQ